jgi:hypothetical protein
MKTRTARLLTLFVVILVIAILPTAGVLARGLDQDAPPVTPPIGEVVLDMAFIMTITAFLKNLFNVSGKPVIGIAFGVFVVIWGVPLVSAAFPGASAYIDSFLNALKLWLGAMGSVDLVTGVGKKIASAKATKYAEKK